MNAYDILGIEAPPNKKQTKKTKNESAVISGGDESAKKSRDITLQEITNDTKVETYEPKLTRPTISVFEYAEIHTMLADYIESHKSVKNFVDDIEIKGNVNPAELAFHLLKEGKWDAVIDRGYEVVSYSKLKINKQLEDTIANYFKEQHEVEKQELFEPLGLI